MSAAPRSPFTVLAEALESASALNGYATVHAGAAWLASDVPAPRIVVFPTTASTVSPATKSAIDDDEQTMIAHVWGTDLDEAWDLRVRLARALDEQAAAGGLFWKRVGTGWDTSSDVTRQGQAVEVTFTIRLAVDRVAARLGEVQSTTQTRI